MNREYICSNDKVEAKDEYGKTRIIDYHDNIEELLIKENIIEQIELERNKLLNEKKHNKNISFKTLKKGIITLLSIPIVLIVLPLIIGVTSLSSLPILGSIIALIIPIYLSLFLIYEYNKTNKINQRIDASLNYLEQELISEEENLKRLNQVKTKANEIITVPVSKRVDDIKELKKLKENLLLYISGNFYRDKTNISSNNDCKEEIESRQECLEKTLRFK